MTLKIKTNGKPRLIIDAHQLTDKERKEFDYLNWEAIDKGEDSATFFRYMGQLYDLGEFMQCVGGTEFSKLGWHGYASDTLFSCLLVKYWEHDNDKVIIGRAYS